MPEWGATPIVSALLIAATISDLRRRQVPTWLTFGGISAGLLAAAVSGWESLQLSLLGATVGGLLLMPFVLTKAFGSADALLLAVIGAWHGAEMVLWAAWWAALVGAVLAVAAYRRGERTFAYVPAIALGAALALVST
ncbi:MAG: prepilin peptidase [Dehalococcoidia bacterium]